MSKKRGKGSYGQGQQDRENSPEDSPMTQSAWHDAQADVADAPQVEPESVRQEAEHEQEQVIQNEIATPDAEAAAEGLYGKFRVERSDGRDKAGGDKEGARYFVLDYVNDPVAQVALRAYIQELTRRGVERSLARDLHRELSRVHQA